MSSAVQRWRDQLAGWAIPDEITSAVDESPWVLPTEVFARRADQAVQQPKGISFHQARAALRPRGSVLDVGAGAGAASLPLAPYLDELTAVDISATMLDQLVERSRRLGISTRTIVGRWPEVASQTPVADVVTCHHVWYNAPDLDTFVRALTSHARRRVVVELTQSHPLAVLNPLWQRLHGLERPTGPSATDAIAVLREAGISPHVREWQREPGTGYGSFADLVALTRRRLCLPAARTDELANALLDLGVDPANPRDLGADARIVTLWWDA